MRIGTCVSKKGKISSGFLRVSYKSKSTKLPIKIIRGDENGKTAFISAGIHGDELNGIKIVSTFFKKVDPSLITGTLIIVPILNPIGFHYGERRVRYDDKDLNRCFGKDKNSFSYKLAQTFMDSVVSQSDFGLDFHDSNKNYILLPHTRIFDKEYKEVDELSRIFGTEIVMKRKFKQGFLASESMKLHKTPVLTVEIGGGMSVSSKYLNEGIRGLNSVLAHKGMLDAEVLLPEKQFILSDRLGYKSPIEGILTINRRLGNVVERNENLAEVYSPIRENSSIIRAKNPGILFSIKANSHIKANERALSLLHFKKQKDEIIPTEAKVILNQATSTIHIYTTGIFNKAMDLMKSHSKDFFEALLNE
ncbi:succinylglutamate desuccinylase/aspartoacylase family protein [Candidatus Woesearchaeota archaeon]|nr:succinylglutamate desuccinylase/aspartoacylase family protein [Candidatus Woesearchaeota archaeon]